MDDFVVARNPDEDSTLPFLVRLPLTPAGVVLKVRETWPRTAKVYCHPSSDWPGDPDIVERVPVRSCVRPGAAIDLVLDRGRENRSQFVFTRARGREVVFWQSAGSLAEQIPVAGTLEPARPTAAEIRTWAVASGLTVSSKGKIPASIVAAFEEARRNGRD